MANHSPHVARLAKRRAHKPLDLADILKILTTAIREGERLLLSAADDDHDLTLRTIHALGQVTGQYAKLLEVGELEARLAALEAQMPGRAA